MMASSDDDRDVARYVLAYLVEMNYSQTTAAFLHECEWLQQTSSQNVMILPKTPLKTLINGYKARQNTGVMIKTLGAQHAWKSLWAKLQHTLDEISSLAQDSLSTSSQTATNRSKRGTSHAKSHPMTRSRVSLTPSSDSTNTRVPSPLSPNTFSKESLLCCVSTASQSVTPTTSGTDYFLQSIITSSSQPVTDGRSPRKKRIQTPKRKEAQTVTLSSNVPSSSRSQGSIDQSEDIQQLLGSLMTNEELPWRLAELINQHVGESDATSSSVLHANSSNLLYPLAEGTLTNTTNSWLDDLINTVFPSENPQTPQLSQQPAEAVCAEVIPLLDHSFQVRHEANGSGGFKRHSDSEEQHVKRLKPDHASQAHAETLTTDSSIALPHGVNLEHFLDQIHN